MFEGVRILKFKNQEAYLYGETQLIYFSDIRECIKNNSDIELIIQNVDHEQGASSFPNSGMGRTNNFNGTHGDDNISIDRQKAKYAPLSNAKLSINQQMKRFPPIVNTLYLDKEIEDELRYKHWKDLKAAQNQGYKKMPTQGINTMAM